MHGGDRDQGPTSTSPDRFASTRPFVKCGLRCGEAEELEERRGGASNETVQCSAAQCIALHRSHCVVYVVIAATAFMSSTSRHHPDRQAPAILPSWSCPLRPHSSIRDGVWLDPCGLTVSCQTCTLAGSTGPQGPVLPGACAREKKREREKREAVSGPAGPAGCPSRTRPRAEGGPGVALGGQGRQKTLHPPGSLHSSPNQKLHLSICSNLNGPDRAPCSPSCPPVARCQRPSGGVTPQGAPGARRAGAILASSLPVSEGL